MAKSKTTFKKGQSGNPGGRSPRVGPNGETLTQLARAHTADALQVLVDVATDKMADANHRVSAAVAILDRGWGKPKESVDIDAKVAGGTVPMIVFERQPDPEPQP